MSQHLKTIDEVRELIRGVLHGHPESQEAKHHLERAMEHVAEAWICESGQNGRTVAQLIGDSVKFRGAMTLALFHQTARDIINTYYEGRVTLRIPDHVKTLESLLKLDAPVAKLPEKTKAA